MGGHGPARLCGSLLRTERQPDGRRKLLQPLGVIVDGEQITVPKDTRTDFSSIPSYARFLVRWSKVDLAGVVHDNLYQEGELPRRLADRVLRLVAVSGTYRANFVQAWIAWFFLRTFGYIAWRQHRKNDRDEITPSQPEDCTDA